MRAIALLDVCTSDYFKGYHLPTIAIPMFDGMTYGDVADAIRNEMNSDYDYLFHEDGFKKEDEELVNQLISDYKEEADKVFYVEHDGCSDDEYNDECTYAYFSIVDTKTINGITFLS